jgi:dTDP-4-amino-4,6-dideoxygalactose transaminase
MKISWNNPSFGEKEIELVTEVLKSGYVSEGPKTKELEKKLSKIVDAKHVIMTTSCTSALYLAIEADKRIRKYESGKVIIPNLNFVAGLNAIEIAKLEPKIIDVDNNKFFLENNPFNITDEKISMPVNLLGRNFVQGEGNEELIVIADNAGCLGSKVSNGKVGCYSLQANKLLTCGQGGFCATDDDEYAKVIRQIKDFGRENKYQNDTKGFNFKFNDIQAAVVLGQLEQLESRKRLHILQYMEYKDNLKNYGKFIDYDLNGGEVPLWIEFITDKRDGLYDYLLNKGIECRKPWECFIQTTDYPNSLFYQDNCIWLPNGSSLTHEQQKVVIKEIKAFYGKT